MKWEGKEDEKDSVHAPGAFDTLSNNNLFSLNYVLTAENSCLTGTAAVSGDMKSDARCKTCSRITLWYTFNTRG